MKLLVVEDEQDLNRIITKKLKAEGYLVDSCFDGVAACDYLDLEEYDGVLMDVMLPKKDGFAVLREMRASGDGTPVIFLTAKGDMKDIVGGLDMGADDYMVKPFQFQELLARIRVMLRKQNNVRENIYRCGELVVDYNTRTVTRAGQNIELSPREFALLFYLVRNQNIVVTREQIEANIWEFDSDITSNVVDVYIRYLRKKIDGKFPVKMIQTIRGVGYTLKSGE